MKDKYQREMIYSDEDRCWIASIPELPGCNAWGNTPERALKELDIVKGMWLETAKEDGEEAPQPLSAKDMNGRFLLRIPKELQRRLTVEAREQGVSLNQYMLYILAQRFKSRKPTQAEQEFLAASYRAASTETNNSWDAAVRDGSSRAPRKRHRRSSRLK